MSEFTDYLHEVFEQFGPITVRKMFGGYGIYHDGLMFGLVADEALYLKTDAENVGDFEREGLAPFEFDKGGKPVRMSCHLAPDDLLEDRDKAAAWARRSYEAALRARKPKRR